MPLLSPLPLQRIDPLYAVFLIAVSVMPYSLTLCNGALVAAGVLWLFVARRRADLKDKEIRRFVLLFASLYFVQVLGMAYTADMEEGRSRLETKMNLLVIPLVVLTYPFSLKQIRAVLFLFSLSMILTALYCHIHAVANVMERGVPFTDLVNSYLYQTSYLIAPIKINVIYSSIYISFACLILLFFLLESRSVMVRLLIFVAMGYLIIFNFLLISRTALVAFVITFFFLSLAKAFERRIRPGRLCIRLIFVLGVFSIAVLLNDNVLLRLSSFYEVLCSREFLNGNDSTSYHFKSWYCSFQDLNWSSVLFGFGTGDESGVLRTCYERHGFQDMIERDFNAHSEYVSEFLRHGMIGLAVLLACLLVPFFYALKAKDWLYVTFIALFAMASLTETTLTVQKGLVFYSVFNAFLFKRLLLFRRKPDGEQNNER